MSETNKTDRHGTQSQNFVRGVEIYCEAWQQLCFRCLWLFVQHSYCLPLGSSSIISRDIRVILQLLDLVSSIQPDYCTPPL